ncbi:MAG: MCE family protein [Actinobacteria bacterium]|nr:MCE family protein [Actinomycetota bacterium]
MNGAIGGRLRTNIGAMLVFSAVVVVAAAMRWIGPAAFGDTYELGVTVPDAGGIQVGHPVTVLGSAVGVVSSTRVTTDDVELVLELDDGMRAPATALVQILRRSPIGEPVVELTPVRSSWEPPGRLIPSQVPVDDDWRAAAPGTRIDPAAVVVPSSVPGLLARADRLLSALPGEDLAIVVDELGTALDGRVGTLRRLNRDGAELTSTLVTAIPDAERLLGSSAEVLQALQRQRDELASAITDTADVLETLAGARPDVEQVLVDATPTLVQLDALVRDQRANLVCLDRDLEAVGEVFARPEGREHLGRILDLNRFFYGGFDAATTWDPSRPGIIWARVNILFDQQGGGQPKIPRTATPATRPGAACASTFGAGVQAVRQTDPPPLPPDETSPGIDYAPLVAGADGGDRDGVRSGAPDPGPAATAPDAELPATGSGIPLGLALALAAVGWAAGRRR